MGDYIRDVYRKAFYLKIRNFVLTVVALTAFPAVMIYAFIQATNTPDVIFSYSTKKCVRVDYPDGTHGDCSKLPKKFNHIWGQ